MKKKIGIVLLALIIVIGIFILTKHGTRFKTKNPAEVIAAMETNQAGVYVFGFEACPWCQDLYPVLEQELTEQKLAANLVDTRKKDFSEDDRSKLAQFITAKTSFDEVVVPLVVMISQDGYFQYHVGTVDGYDAVTTEINAAQKSELKANLQKMFETYKRHNG